MWRPIGFAACTALLCLSWHAAARELPKDPREWPVVPVWLAHGQGPITAGAQSASDLGSMDCPEILGFSSPSSYVAPYFDPVSRTTWIFAGDYPNDRIVRYEVDSALNVTSTPLAATYRVVWAAVDLDLDGEIELVGQAGDPGFGGNGYLDILSAPDWMLRQRFVLPGEKFAVHAQPVNVDADPYLEVFLTPGAIFFGPYRVMLIDYSSATDSFVVLTDLVAPVGAYGISALADFDEDGRVEFISGSDLGYALFEYDGNMLSYIGPLGDSTAWDHHSAATVRPKPDGKMYALLGHSSGDTLGYVYHLIHAIADNTFEITHIFREVGGGSGVHPCLGADTDCDGLDELVMTFYPAFKEWEWDVDSAKFVRGCTWDENALGTFVYLSETDLDQNGVAEWAFVNHQNFLRMFADTVCADCNESGRCLVAGPWCDCPCHGDPVCDGQADVLDVVEVVSVAFRGGPSAGPLKCPRDDTDFDCNGVTDVLDLIGFIDVVFRGAADSARFCEPCDD